MYVDLKKQQDNSLFVVDAIDGILKSLEEDVSYITVHTRFGSSISIKSKDFTDEQLEELRCVLAKVQSTHLFKLEKFDELNEKLYSIIKESGLV